MYRYCIASLPVFNTRASRWAMTTPVTEDYCCWGAPIQQHRPPCSTTAAALSPETLSLATSATIFTYECIVTWLSGDLVWLRVMKV
ncbi:hypothetical protein FKM82_028085 [Ascaphus truei]